MARTCSVRCATHADIAAVIEIGHRFHDATVYGQAAELDNPTLIERLGRLVQAKDGLLLVAEERGEIVGTLGAIVTTPWFNKHRHVMQELFWWVNPEARGTGAGGALFEALEDASERLGMPLLMMRTPNIEPAVMDRLYRMKGFVPWDSYYMKLR